MRRNLFGRLAFWALLGAVGLFPMAISGCTDDDGGPSAVADVGEQPGDTDSEDTVAPDSGDDTDVAADAPDAPEDPDVGPTGVTCGDQSQQFTFGGGDEQGYFFERGDGSLRFAWVSGRDEPTSGADVWMVGSEDGGITWGRAAAAMVTPLNDTPLDLFEEPGPTGDTLTALVSVTDDIPPYDIDHRAGLLFVTSAPDGVNFGEPTVLYDFGLGTTAIGLDRAADGTLWAALVATPGEHAEVYVTSSSDGGVTWADAEVLSDHPRQDDVAYAATEPSGRVAVAWIRYDLIEPPPEDYVEPYLYDTSDIVLSVNDQDGDGWKTIEVTSDVGGQLFTDSLPSLFRGPGGALYLTWLTTRGDAPEARVVAVADLVPYGQQPVADAAAVAHQAMPEAGWNYNSHPLDDGRILLLWSKQADGDGSRDDHCLIVDDFDFSD